MNSDKTLRILLIEDLSQDAELIERQIKRSGYQLNCERADTSAAMREALEHGNWDLVLSDFNLPGFGALEALEILKKSGRSLPFIVISGAIGEETAVELLKAGADDYVMKSKLERLVPAIERSLREHHSSFLAEQAQSAREHLLAVVSHDLKNPLGGISLNLQVALKKLDDASKDSDLIPIQSMRPMLERAQRSSQRMLALIQGILDQTNIQSGKLTLKKERSSASILIQELADLFQPLAEKKSIRFEIREENEECLFDFDFERLFQALGNLIGNAIKFTPEGGEIFVWYESSAEQVSFFVRDTGVGIPHDQHAFIFRRFWQAKHTTGQGLGLGLSICRGIVESHHGRIQVLSEEGKGCTFQVILPREQANQTPKTRVKAARILLVDDDESLGETVSEMLRGRGFQVDWAKSAEAGLRLLSEAKVRFSLVVVDFQLPGMNGGDFCKSLRAASHENSQVPTILCSADSDLMEVGKKLPVNGVLPKPIDLAHFLPLVEKTLRSRAVPGVSERSIHNYLARRIEDLKVCRQAFENSDYESIRSIAHRVKGSASTFGFPELTEIARKLELVVSDADPSVIRDSILDFEGWVNSHPPGLTAAPSSTQTTGLAAAP